MIIDNVNFYELETQKYWSFPKSYKKDPKVETKNMIFSGDYIGARKMDGAFYKFIKDEDGNMGLFGRSKSVTGVYLNKINWVPQLQSFFNALPNGTCLLGEIYFPDKEGSSNVTTIMGCLEEKARERQHKNGYLYYYIFDVLAYNGISLYKKNIEDRVQYLEYIENHFNHSNIKFANYYDGKDLWEHLQITLIAGGEGVVITKKGTCYQPGKRPARQTLKIKKEISQTIDCFFTGRYTPPTRKYEGKEIETWKFWENQISGKKLEGEYYLDYYKGEPIEPITKPYFYGWAGSLEVGVLKDGVTKPIGFLSGLTDEIKGNVEKYAHKPFELTCMEVLPTGGLRHAKFLNWRPDLNLADCTWDKIFGG